MSLRLKDIRYPKLPPLKSKDIEWDDDQPVCVPLPTSGLRSQTRPSKYNDSTILPDDKYLEFLGKLFCAILYAYCGVCSMLVPQNFMCNASVIAVNLSTYQIGFHAVNLEGCVVNSFEPCSIHIRLYDTTSTNIFISGNMYCGWCDNWNCNLAQIWPQWLT